MLRWALWEVQQRARTNNDCLDGLGQTIVCLVKTHAPPIVSRQTYLGEASVNSASRSRDIARRNISFSSALISSGLSAASTSASAGSSSTSRASNKLVTCALSSPRVKYSVVRCSYTASMSRTKRFASSRCRRPRQGTPSINMDEQARARAR
eukprot:scaffold957_cov402-Prasinococcus_capsulatus_cf.AAC.13